MRRALLSLGLSLGSLGSLTACFPGFDQPCTDLFAFGLSVTVTDETGSRVCDAVVTASEGAFEEQLEVQGDDADCVYVGAGERAGTYRIEAAKEGYVTRAEDNVVVGEDECHVIGEQVALELEVD